MKFDYLLMCSPAGELRLKLPGHGQALSVCTVSEATQILGRTRRQVYRHIREGRLRAPRKVLGEWLVDRASVERLARRPPAVQKIPQRLQHLFPEYDVARLNVGLDRVLILARVLARGSIEDLRWALRRYAREQIKRFIVEEGARTLPPRALALWSLVFGVKPEPRAAWRGSADPWSER